MPNIIYMSMTAMPLIAVIAAVRFFTVYRLPKKTFYILWSIVLCCLFIPFNLLPQLNVLGVIDKFDEIKERFVKAPKTAEVMTNTADISVSEDTVNENAETISPSMFYNIYDTVGRLGKDMFDRIDVINSGTGANNITKTAEHEVQTSNIHISPLLLVWLAGFMLCAAYFTISHIRFRRKYAPSLPVDSTFVRNWKVERSDATKRKIKIKQSDLLVSPLTYGIFKPVILLPKITDYNDEKKLEYILTHEYTHIRRFDTLTKLLLTAALCLHWFNPFVWLMYILANRDIELSCDETVVQKIKTAENIKSDYAMTLIALEEKKALRNAAVSYFSKNIMKERIKSIMKLKKTSKARVLLAVILVSIVATLFIAMHSCKKDDETDVNDIETPKSETLSETQESTNKLVLYNTAFTDFVFTEALKIYKLKYPEVEIELHEYIKEGTTIEIDEYKELLKTELAAGKGPDLILGIPDHDLSDIYKVMDAGIFLDLNPLIENDDEFNMEEYNKVVIESGIYKGKRYVMPIEYSLPILLTTQEILDTEGITRSDLATFDAFINTAKNYNEKYKDIPNKSIIGKFYYYGAIVQNTFPWFGIDLINYSESKVEFDNPQLKSVLEIMKREYVSKENAANIITNNSYETATALQNQERLFEYIAYDFTNSLYTKYMSLLKKKLTPVIVSFPDINNQMTGKVSKFAAIPKTSKNQINAYNLLKIILSEEVQGKIMAFIDIPVLNSAIKLRSETYIYEGFDFIWKDGRIVENPALNPSIPRDVLDDYIKLITNLDSCKLISYAPKHEFFMRDMEPYFEDKKSYEECAAILKNNLELYLSE